MDGNPVVAVFQKILATTKESFLELLPNLLGALAVILVGLITAYILRAASNRLLRNFGRLIPKRDIQARFDPVRMERSAKVISRLLYWIILLFFFTAATEILGLPVFTTWLGGIARYLPRLLVAVLIVAAGIIGGVVLRDAVTSAARTAGIAHGNILGAIASYALIIVTVFIGIQGVGINIEFLTILVLILLAGLLLGAALAFGLGARTSVSNILASHYVQKFFQVGQTVKIGEMEGRILEFTATSVILESREGQAHVPAKQFGERTSLVRKEEM